MSQQNTGTHFSSENPAISTIQDIAHGNMPSNVQINQVLDTANEYIDQQRRDATLPLESAKVLGDTQQFIEATQQLLEHKNADEKLQKFATASAQAAKDTAEAAKDEVKRTANDPNNRSKANQVGRDARKAGQAAFNVLQSTARNGEFRKFILDFVSLVHDLLLKSSSKRSSSKGQQQQQQLGSTSAQPAGLIPVSHPNYTTLSFTLAQPTFNEPSGTFPQTATSFETTTTTYSVVPTTSAQPSVSHDDNNDEIDWGDVKEGSEWIKDIPEETKHELSYRVVSFLRRINANPQYSQGINNLFDALDDLREEAKRAAENVKDDSQSNQHIHEAYEAAKKIVAEFHDPEILLKELRSFSKDLQNDHKMNKLLDDTKALFQDSINNPQVLDEYKLIRRVEKLVDEARDSLQDNKWREHYQRVLHESQALFNAIKNDRDVVNLTDKAQQLLTNFTFVDQNGIRHFNSDLLGQMRQYIVPLFLKQLENIPIPPIEGSTDDYDFKVENITFSGREIIPEHVEIHVRSDMDFNVPKLQTDKASTRALLKISHVKTHMDNVKFWFKRKSIPRLEDHGIADIALSGEGATLMVLLRLSTGWEHPNFSVLKVSVDIDKIQIDIKQAQHQVLLNMITTFFQGKLKRDVENTIENRITDIFHDLESGFNELMIKYPPSRLGEMVKEQVMGSGISGSSITTPSHTS